MAAPLLAELFCELAFLAGAALEELAAALVFAFPFFAGADLADEPGAAAAFVPARSALPDVDLADEAGASVALVAARSDLTLVVCFVFCGAAVGLDSCAKVVLVLNAATSNVAPIKTNIFFISTLVSVGL